MLWVGCFGKEIRVGGDTKTGTCFQLSCVHIRRVQRGGGRDKHLSLGGGIDIPGLQEPELMMGFSGPRRHVSKFPHLLVCKV